MDGVLRSIVIAGYLPITNMRIPAMKIPTTPKKGSVITVVAHSDSASLLFAARIVNQLPLVLESLSPTATSLQPEDRVVLLSFEDELISKAEVTVGRCLELDETRLIEVFGGVWEILDRRRHPRHSIELSATVRRASKAPGESGGEVSDRRHHPRHSIELSATVRRSRKAPGETEARAIPARTRDLSLGGAMLSANEALDKGDLVEIELRLGTKQWARLLGIVAWTDQPGTNFAVEFLEFVDSARSHLHNFLAEAA